MNDMWPATPEYKYSEVFPAKHVFKYAETDPRKTSRAIRSTCCNFTFGTIAGRSEPEFRETVEKLKTEGNVFAPSASA